MSTIVRELLRLRSDRAARTGLAVGLAVLYVLVVVAWNAGPSIVLEALLLAPSIVLWRRGPVVAVVLAGAACIVLPLSQWSTQWQINGIGPLLLVVLPILGAALDDRAPVRAAGVALATLFPVCVAIWGVESSAFSGAAPTLMLSAVVLAALPLVVAAAWRRPAMRAAVLTTLRDRAPSIERGSRGFRVGVGVAVVAYLLAVVLGLGERDLRPVLTALPAAAGFVWFRSRTDVALALAAAAWLLVAVLAPIDSSFRTGLTLTCLYTGVPVFGAATSGSRTLQKAGVALVVGAGLLSTLLSGSIAVGFVVVALGALPFLFELAAGQTRFARRMRSRLRESEQRGQVAERDVRVEQERNRIAREVHDVVAHSLAVVIAQADGARFAAERSPEAVGPALEAIAETARGALGEVRTMLHDLKDDGGVTAVPGARDIPVLLDGVRALDVEVDEAVFGEPWPLEEDADLAMFRIVQEALTNALRHGAKPGAVRVETDWGASTVVVAITNRTDPDATAATERAGHGIPGMQDRARLAGGECTAGAGSDGSFRVRVVLPVDRAAAPVDADADVDAQDPLASLLGGRSAFARG